MQQVNTDINIYDIFKNMSDNQILLIYQGLFDQEMVKSVLSITEKKLIGEQVVEGTRKKLFNIIMEGLQNICKHQTAQRKDLANPFFMIGKTENDFNVITGNIIDNEKISVVKNKLDHINSLSPEDLKEYYKQARLNSVISNVGGAGLGFIDMARKSGNKLDYRFYNIDEQFSYFILNNKVNNN